MNDPNLISVIDAREEAYREWVDYCWSDQSQDARHEFLWNRFLDLDRKAKEGVLWEPKF